MEKILDGELLRQKKIHSVEHDTEECRTSLWKRYKGMKTSSWCYQDCLQADVSADPW